MADKMYDYSFAMLELKKFGPSILTLISGCQKAFSVGFVAVHI